MGARLPQYPPTVKTLPDGKPNPLYDPDHKRPAPPPPPPPKKVAMTLGSIVFFADNLKEHIR